MLEIQALNAYGKMGKERQKFTYAMVNFTQIKISLRSCRLPRLELPRLGEKLIRVTIFVDYFRLDYKIEERSLDKCVLYYNENQISVENKVSLQISFFVKFHKSLVSLYQHMTSGTKEKRYFQHR